jgi:hypothetical protein
MAQVHTGYLKLSTHTHTHSEYVTIIALPQQQVLQECASVLRDTYIVCVVIISFSLRLLNYWLLRERISVDISFIIYRQVTTFLTIVRC